MISRLLNVLIYKNLTKKAFEGKKKKNFVNIRPRLHGEFKKRIKPGIYKPPTQQIKPRRGESGPH